MAIEITDRISSVPAEEWNRLGSEDDPFTEHAFLAALEDSGSVGKKAGASPRFVLARDLEGRLVGAVPLYLKSHSYGEFIFDWSWANAANRGGIRYYPKLVAAIPFTPATGNRLLLAPDADAAKVTDELIAGMRAVADDERVSSIHVLFCTEAETHAFARHGLRPRLSLQFHWHNRPAPPYYRDFDDYLGDFKSRHRKQVRRERAVAAGHGLTLRTLTGQEMGDTEWQALQDLYSANAGKHGSIEYLTPEFFGLIRATHAHRVVATLAYRDDLPVAGTFNFEKGRHIYGRYWGCHAEYQMLHFELCYHRLIERAIARGCTLFEAGAQGEHKLKRGLLPSFTHSAHWIRHPQLSEAVYDFIEAEAAAVREQAAALATESPFRAPGEGSAEGGGD